MFFVDYKIANTRNQNETAAACAQHLITFGKYSWIRCQINQFVTEKDPKGFKPGVTYWSINQHCRLTRRRSQFPGLGAFLWVSVSAWVFPCCSGVHSKKGLSVNVNDLFVSLSGPAVNWWPVQPGCTLPSPYLGYPPAAPQLSAEKGVTENEWMDGSSPLPSVTSLFQDDKEPYVMKIW